MDVTMFDFPTMRDGRIAVETKYCELLNLYRRGEQLDEIEIDWLDSANTWLINTETTSNERR